MKYLALFALAVVLLPGCAAGSRHKMTGPSAKQTVREDHGLTRELIIERPFQEPARGK